MLGLEGAEELVKRVEIAVLLGRAGQLIFVRPLTVSAAGTPAISSRDAEQPC